MVWVLLAMLVILVAAALVAAYVAYPSRGQELPGAPWVGELLDRGVDALPTLENERAGRRR